MAQLGLRRNEALGLVWSDIDLESSTIRLTAQLGRSTPSAGGSLVRRELKTMSSRRLLAISETLRDRLGLIKSAAAVREPDTHHVITFKAGARVDPDGVTQWLASIGEEVGVKVSPHRLRHTAATLMLNEGVPIEAISRVLGHSDSRTTRVYAKVLDRSADAALGTLAELLERSDSGRV